VKILITGASGFIGAHLTKHCLEQGHTVDMCDNNARGQQDAFVDALVDENESCRFLKIDLTKSEEVSSLSTDYDIVFHLAAINGTENFYKIPYTVMDVAIRSTMLLLEHFKDTATRFVFSSSSEVYAGTVSKDPSLIPTSENIECTIDDVTNTRFSYGGSKLACEILINSFSEQYGMDYQVIRYHNIYGPRMGTKHVMPQFIRRAKEGESPFSIYGAVQTRAFCYVSDAVRATLDLALAPESTGIYHIGNDQEEVPISTIAKIVVDWYNLAPNFTIHDAPGGSVPRRSPSLDKLRRAINYKPAVSLVEGLNLTISWYNDWYETVDMNILQKGVL